jgi:replication factor C large subunit
MKPWVEKYRPRRLREVAGNPGAVRIIANWGEEWKKGFPEKRAILIYGPAGVGKTSVALALADELGYDSIELNASDTRTYGVINRIVGTASRQGSLRPGDGKKVIILDEVDGIHGKAEYGGLRALQKWVKETVHPMVLIANDPYALPREFRELTKMVQLKRINQRTVLRVLKEICRREGIKTDERVLKIIATNANGDLRAAINDLQALTEGKKSLTLGDIDILTIRDSELRIFDTLVRILKTESCDRAREAVRESGEEPETIMKWIQENLPREYEDPEDLARAFERLSKADIYMGRIKRRQAWNLLPYAIDMFSAGVALAKKRRYRRFVRYQYPTLFSLYARTKKSRALIDSIASKIKGARGTVNEKVHVSKRVAREEFFPLLRAVFNRDPARGAEMASELGLELEEIRFFTENDQLAHRIHEEAKKITAARLRERIRGGRQVLLSEFQARGK